MTEIPQMMRFPGTRDPRYELVAPDEQKGERGILRRDRNPPSRLMWIASSSQLARQDRLAQRWSQAVALLRESVVFRENLRSGVPCLSGTRLTVAQIIAQLAEGESIDELAEDMEIDREMVVKFLNGLSMILNRPAI